MVLVDSLFIIELFLRSWFNEQINENDRIFNKPRMIVEATCDIRIEENQRPFSILKGLYDLAFGSSSGHPLFIDLAYNFFMGKNKTVTQRIANADVKHFIDFLRLCHLPSTLWAQQHGSNNLKSESCPRVTQLSEASTHLLNIRLSKGIMGIPRLVNGISI
ncbi:hypothetical protein Cgig2_024068 [Carnegiea gigantea]|uniref:Uncharacterized protein n=1 Tax=Carnegiea gigantea TaxID=171969 RepID=A0A9Q1K6I5_9CARY|nr:hypothetical protein Cgig2_024068 [Carnegiea gigantea]